MDTPRSADTRLAKGSGVIGLALGAMSLVLGTAARLLDGSIPWTAWALPALLISVVVVTLYVPPGRFPRAMKVYHLFAIVSALCIITSLGRRLMHFAERAI
jgi:hypothetical protein